ncbi:voltage-gated potassium channel [Aureococcus anophagefferens]|nr:voltage-gated potassium channel [Aureococcus anophagefferens]
MRYYETLWETQHMTTPSSLDFFRELTPRLQLTRARAHANMIRQIPFMRKISRSMMEHLIQSMRPEIFMESEAVMRRKDIGDWMLVHARRLGDDVGRVPEEAQTVQRSLFSHDITAFGDRDQANWDPTKRGSVPGAIDDEQQRHKSTHDAHRQAGPSSHLASTARRTSRGAALDGARPRHNAMRRLPLLLCLPAALALTLRPARLADAWGVGRVCADAFYPPGSKVNGVDARYAWASTVLQRLVAMRSALPSALLAAVGDAGVVGCVELGLLPAPPGAPPASRLSTEASEAAALWRGVAVDNAVAWAPPEGDCPTLANVAVARSHRKRAVGRRLVDAAADALEGDVARSRAR